MTPNEEDKNKDETMAEALGITEERDDELRQLYVATEMSDEVKYSSDLLILFAENESLTRRELVYLGSQVGRFLISREI